VQEFKAAAHLSEIHLYLAASHPQVADRVKQTQSTTVRAMVVRVVEVMVQPVQEFLGKVLPVELVMVEEQHPHRQAAVAVLARLVKLLHPVQQAVTVEQVQHHQSQAHLLLMQVAAVVVDHKRAAHLVQVVPAVAVMVGHHHKTARPIQAAAVAVLVARQQTLVVEIHQAVQAL
jgi:hypothetical protein